jgi:hypothetical protein
MRKRGSTKAVYLCSTRLFKGALKPPEGTPEQLEGIEDVLCPYTATFVQKRKQRMKFWTLDLSNSNFEHINCVGSAKPSTKVIAELSTMR